MIASWVAINTLPLRIKLVLPQSKTACVRRTKRQRS